MPGLKHSSKDAESWFPTALLALVPIIVCFIFLNRGVLYYDEAIYAQVAKETVEGNHWITLHWNGQPWFHKPPLYFWITALLFKSFGPSEFGARALSALAGVGCVVVCYLIAKHLYDRTAAIISGLILLTSALFVVSARSGTTDVLMTFFIALAVYAYLRSESKRESWITVGVACGLAVLTKGAAGVLAPAIIGIAVLTDRRLYVWKLKHFWLGIAICFILAASWHVVLFAVHGSRFLEAYLYRQVIERSAADLHQYGYGPAFYFGVLWNFVWPWILLLPLALVAAVTQRHSKVLVVQVVLPFVLFSLARTKFAWYLVPILPALAVLSAAGIRSVLEHVSQRTQRLAFLVLALFSLVGTLEVFRHSKTKKEIQAVAELMPSAAKDRGAISTCPESLEMTVLYYSNRKLCADPVVSPLSFEQVAKCEQGEIRHFIFQSDKRGLVESRFGPIRVIAESDGVAYGEVNLLTGVASPH